MDDPRVGFFIQVIVGVRRSTSWTVGVARFLIVALALGSLIVPVAASSDRMVIVGFRGLYTDPPGTAGMDHLAASLSAARTSNRPFSIRVFDWPEREQAFDFVRSFTDRSCLIVIGHSLGGNAAVRLADERLVPAGIDVDLLIQLDSVGRHDHKLPDDVQGVNYFQHDTRLAWRLAIQDSVEGATPVPIEQTYGVSPDIVTHTTIDDPLFGFTRAHYERHFGSQPDLHARIDDDVDTACPPP